MHSWSCAPHQVYMEQQKWGECFKHYDEALRIRTACYGQGHFEVAVMSGNMGMALMKRGEASDLERAEELLKQAIEGLQGGDRARYQYNYGKLLEKAGRLDEALEVLESARKGYHQAELEDMEKVSGEGLSGSSTRSMS